MDAKELVSRYDIGEREFESTNLKDCWLSWANLPKINFRRACLELSILEGVNLVNADLTEANLTRVDLTIANLAHANLQGSNLEGADLRGANLSHTNMTDANLSGVDFTGADLSYAILPKNYIFASQKNSSDKGSLNRFFLTLSGLVKGRSNLT